LNADGYVNANGDLVGYNMYAYCNNNPVLYFDSSGHSWKSVLAGAISLLTIIAVVTLEILSPSKEEHYARNSHNEIPDDDELLGIVQGENDKWHKADDSMNRYHRNTNGIQGEEAMYNKKYMTEGNESEVIICYDPVHVPVPYRVTDPNNIGTYNYGEGIFEHFVYDVWPYWKWGNSPDDTTSEWDHIVGRN
jgi:hypothetical protein